MKVTILVAIIVLGLVLGALAGAAIATGWFPLWFGVALAAVIGIGAGLLLRRARKRRRP